jgi:hypothetical protein
MMSTNWPLVVKLEKLFSFPFSSHFIYQVDSFGSALNLN